MTHDDVPTEIRVVAFVGDRPLAGAWFEVELPMHRKNSYTLLFGPADERGAVTISRQQLVRSVSQVNHLFPMDYTRLQGWTREVVIKPVNRIRPPSRSSCDSWSGACVTRPAVHASKFTRRPIQREPSR
jgi:hypothetical protein